MDTGVLIVLCTFPDLDQARQIGAVLVEKQAAACVNLIPGVRSIFRWEGNLDESGEVLAVFKTTRAVFPEFERRLTDLHPYDVPEILAIPVERGAEAYLRWVGSETGA